MTTAELQQWLVENPLIALGALILSSVAFFLLARLIIGRGLAYIARRTETKIDDIIVEHLRPFRVAWLAPLITIYALAYLVPEYQSILEKATLFLILWVAVATLSALLTALNQIYESRPTYSGVSIGGYLDILRLLVILVAVILSVSLLTGESPVVLLTGLGAITAVLLLVFRDTILSLVASIQITAQGLVKEGDWIEVPSYEADGDVLNITLHSITIQNFDKTITRIPTYKITEVAYKNWRGMQESGGRRIKRALSIDMNSIRFCTPEMFERLKRIQGIKEFLEAKQHETVSEEGAQPSAQEEMTNQRRLTNVGVFRAYMDAYLRSHPSIHTEEMAFLVRQLPPSPEGLPLEIYAFTKTVDWVEYESIQAEIFDHLIAAAQAFDLRIFQQPTGLDFAVLAQ